MGLNSIWKNDFYNTPPLPTWSYEIDFTGFGDFKSSSILNKAIVSVPFPKREISIVKTYYAGIESNHTGRVQNTGEVSITFSEDNNLTVTNILENIFSDSSSNDKYFTNEGGYVSNPRWNKIGKNIRIKMLKPNIDGYIETENLDNVIKEVVLYNCILIGIQESNLSYNDKENTIEKTVRIAYDFHTYPKNNSSK